MIQSSKINKCTLLLLINKHLERMAVALALTKLRFSLPYKVGRSSALALLELVARREARSDEDSIASAMGTQTHPSSFGIIAFFAQ